MTIESVPGDSLRIEKSSSVPEFNDKDREKLLRNGAFVCVLTGETVTGQIRAGKRIWLNDTDFRTATTRKPLILPSMLGEVAIFPDKERFMIQGSNNLARQAELIRRATKDVQEEFETRKLKVIIPDRPSTLTELGFEYFSERGRWLFGKEISGPRSARTGKITSAKSSYTGVAFSYHGLIVFEGIEYAFMGNYLVRLIVPSEVK